MKILVLSLLALVLGAVAFAVLAVDPFTSMANEPDPVRPDSAGSNADLLARIEALREETRELRDHLALAELARPSSQRTPVVDGFVSKEEFDAFRDEVREALKGGNALAGASASPRLEEQLAFKERVASTLSEIRSDETVAKVDAKHQARLDRLDDRMATLEVKLGLTSPQSSALRSALQAQYDRDADLERRWREGEDVAVLGEVKASNRAASQSELSGILTPEQLTTYGTLLRSGAGK